MSQKIPAFYYIKNNKKRVAVLVTSLAMFFIITYTSMFLLSVSSETFRSVLTGTSSHIQYITFGAKDLEFNKTGAKALPENIYMEAVYKKYNEIKDNLKKCSGIKDAFIIQAEYSYITALIGNYYIELPMLNKEQMEAVLKHMGATLSEGRLPDKAGEVVLDRKIMKNYGHKTGDVLSQNKNIKITGVIDCDYYFGCGLADENKTFLNPMLCVLTDGTVKDLENTIKKQKIVLKHSEFIDVKQGRKKLQTEIISTISSSTNIIFIGILIVVGILVVIVSISYMRDRRSEWCLYASTGYSRRTIYFSILRELLFTFVTAFIIAAAITIILMKVTDTLLITELGLRCVYFMPEPFMQILCSYIALFGIMQIPVRFEINKIKTIDAIDDDM